MRTVDIIRKKRDGMELTSEEIAFLIRGCTDGSIPDYQLSAWAMAVYYQGMTARETADLTMEMARSGDQMDLSAIHGIKVDKHSTGGVGDTTTLILAPLVAAAGVPVAKMSGRGLGHTGGTIDKLEAIPGYEVERTEQQFIDQVNQVGAAVISQTGNITPADKKLYSLRDVTATVNSIPLIASSVMSKKIASGADAIVLDVKTGNGAFMKSLEESIDLAEAMVAIGTEVGRETVAVITGMDEPLGRSIGNALEVKEAIRVLQGKEAGSPLLKVTLMLGAHMLLLGGKANDYDEAKGRLAEAIANGSALNKLKQIIKAQGGEDDVVDRPELLHAGAQIVPVVAAQDGWIESVAAEEIGRAAMTLGAGRATTDDKIDLGVGIVLHKRSGDRVAAGETLADLHVSSASDVEIAEINRQVLNAFSISESPVPPKPLVYAVITKDGITRGEEVRL
ncbi:pyrimidine-nucleoside phosphorylase [Paenibacillus sp. J2TS4]|uniref:pyrimidine-nucleoside phosphorylase n=1 Tax=Paenibacillus sp. J2TS4 TaxID=2807194 RepID=UPI001B136E74|nr:pyrimidine-nucleoside phosphorylase [Paenibacillus sp. J2TS4]GIP32315.1 pyrimidine-nucleoside phosphorylase [Paenibacillus sp. J2TS4]